MLYLQAGRIWIHLLLHCGLTMRIWGNMVYWFGTSRGYARDYERVDVQLEEREKEEKTRGLEHGSTCVNVVGELLRG